MSRDGLFADHPGLRNVVIATGGVVVIGGAAAGGWYVRDYQGDNPSSIGVSSVGEISRVCILDAYLGSPIGKPVYQGWRASESALNGQTVVIVIEDKQGHWSLTGPFLMERTLDGMEQNPPKDPNRPLAQALQNLVNYNDLVVQKATETVYRGICLE